MPKNRIKTTVYERCLLTDVLPYETPLRFSNWGSYNYIRNLDILSKDSILSELFCPNRKYSIPFHYNISKDLFKKRTLQLIHPNNSKVITDLYQDFDAFIAKLCSKSEYSIRAPHGIATSFIYGKGKDEKSNYLKTIDINDPYASTYFTYKNFTHLYKFFNSSELLELEKKYKFLLHFDISNCFPSIYTHSIAWAVRGKQESKYLLDKRKKDKSFAIQFDKLMQKMNYNETNGIPVGPELSRIFSEILLQDVDVKIAGKMEENDYINNSNYNCCRYMDDFFLFYNSNEVKDCFYKTTIHELEKYKLYINSSKTDNSERPFITNVSKKKLEVSDCFNALMSKLSERKFRTDKNVLDKLRLFASELGGEYYALSNVVFSIIQNNITQFNKLDDNDVKEKAIQSYLKIAFQWFSIDSRVNNSYKITRLIITILEELKGFISPIREHIKNVIYNYLYVALNQESDYKNPLVTINLLFAIKELSVKYDLSEKIILDLMEKSKVYVKEDERNKPRLTYYSIVGFLYYISDSSKFKTAREFLIKQSNVLIEANDPRFFAETAYLLIDLIRCPFLSKDEKFELVNNYSKHLPQNISDSKKYKFIKTVNKYDWYFDWEIKNTNLMYLEKKRFIVSY